MSKANAVEQKTEELLTPIAEKCGVRVYDVDYVKEGPERFLRCFIDKDGGVNIGDCEAVSRLLSDALDEADFIPDAYTLEVSSPGLGRSLTKDRHFAQSIGQEVEGTLFKPLEGSKDKTFTGILKAFDENSVTIEESDGNEKVLPRSGIAKIRLTIDF